MSLPTISSVSPTNNATGVVLGIPIVVTFSAIMDHTTINGGSFALFTSNATQILSPTEEIQQLPKPTFGKQNLPGVFSFDDTTGVTIVTFTPSIPLQPNSTYSIVIMGTGSLINQVVKDISGNVLDNSYNWTFTTGILNLVTPPVQSPIITLRPDIDPCSIVVVPRKKVIGNDLTQEIDLIFPGPIDTTTFNVNDILLSVEPILGDPSVVVPTNLNTSLTISGNTMRIVITGWPS